MGEGRETVIRFGKYNIQNGRYGVLESYLWGVEQANLDMGVFQYTKVDNGFYTHALTVYRVFEIAVPSRHCGGWLSSTGAPPISRSMRYISMGRTC